jgi:hypothetical protein
MPVNSRVHECRLALPRCERSTAVRAEGQCEGVLWAKPSVWADHRFWSSFPCVCPEPVLANDHAYVDDDFRETLAQKRFRYHGAFSPVFEQPLPSIRSLPSLISASEVSQAPCRVAPRWYETPPSSLNQTTTAQVCPVLFLIATNRSPKKSIAVNNARGSENVFCGRKIANGRLTDELTHK